MLKVDHSDYPAFPPPFSASLSATEERDTVDHGGWFGAWDKLTAGLPLEKIKGALDNATKDITSQGLTKQIFQNSFARACPLVAMAPFLLDSLSRYMPWDLPWSRKGLLIPLITCLPLLRSRSVVDRVIDMSIPVPLAYHIPTRYSGVQATATSIEPFCYAIPFSSLRNGIIPGKPFLVSCGTPNSVGCGKSIFLNMCFQTDFEVDASSNSFHRDTADVMLDRPLMPLPYNIIDCHGTIPRAILQILSSICRIGLIHIMPTDASEGGLDEVVELMETLCVVEMIVVLLRDAEEWTLELRQLLEERVYDWERSQSTIAVHIIEIPRIQPNEHDEFYRWVQRHCLPALESLPDTDKVEGFYEELQDQLIKTMNIVKEESHSPAVDLRTSSKEAIILNEALRLALAKAEATARDCSFVEAIFPLSHIAMETKKFNLLVANLENERETRNLLEVGHNLKVTKIRAIQEQNQYKEIVNMFLRTVVHKKDMENLDEFSNLITNFGEYTYLLQSNRSSGASRFTKAIRRKRGAPIPISIDNLWREAWFVSKENNFGESISIFEKLVLSHGRSLEILNGDLLPTDTYFLTDILNCAKDGNLLACAVLGPQNSQKALLLKYLLGYNVFNSAERCTKGLYASLFTTQYRRAENLLVLDAEWLLDNEKWDFIFDEQMAFLTLSLSHIVLIDVKEGTDKEIMKTLEKAMFRFKIHPYPFHSPQLLFILHDMDFWNRAKRQKAVQNILDGVCDIERNTGFKLNVSAESIIVLPPALLPRQQSNLFGSGSQTVENDSYTRNIIFSQSIEQLKSRLLEDTVTDLAQRRGPKIPFRNLTQWMTHAFEAWEIAQMPPNI